MENNQMPGGYLVGDSHANGGIKIKTPEGQIEAEGGEVIINKRALALQDKYVCEGTPKEMTSKINEMEGGVSWSNTGSCRLVRQAADGTEIEEEASIADDGFGLLYTKNNKTYIITTDTKDQLEIVEMALTDFKDGLINKEELENTLQSNINEEVEFTTQIDMISGKPFAYDQFYGGYIELMSSEPINIDYSSAMAKDGKKIENSFTIDSNGNYMNTEGYELIDNFDGMYQVLDPKGMDIVGEYLTLEDGMQAIKDYMENSNVESEFSETEKAAFGSFIFGKEYNVEDNKPFRLEVKNKISEMENEYESIRKDYRYGILNTEEYLELKKELVDKYAVYTSAAERLNVAVNRGIFMGLQKEKDIPMDQASSGTILRSSNPEKRPSPSVSATIYPAGYTMEGNDGNMWEIALDSRGIHRWKRVKAEDGMSMAEDGKSMFPKSQINYGFNYLNIDGNLVNYSYTFYKENGPVCDVYFDVTIGAEDRNATDFSFDYSSERTYSKDYIVTEMVAVEYNIVDYIEMGEEPSSDTRVSLSQEDMSRVSSEIDAIYREKIEGKAQPINEILTKEEKNNILASNKLAANGKQISKCDCGCGIAKDGAEVSSCGCSHSKYTNGGKVDYYKDKQSGRIVTEQEMLDMVDEDDQLDSFYLIGSFSSKDAYKDRVVISEIGSYSNEIDAKKVADSNNKFFKETNQPIVAEVISYPMDMRGREVKIKKVVAFKKEKYKNGGGVYALVPYIESKAEKWYYRLKESSRIHFSKKYPRNNNETNEDWFQRVWIESGKSIGIKRNKYAEGGGVDGGVKYIPYKDEEIMYEPTYNKYYVNDEEFDSLKEAQNYIDGGSPMSAQTINAYRHGAFANGGGIGSLQEIESLIAKIKKAKYEWYDLENEEDQKMFDLFEKYSGLTGVDDLYGLLAFKFSGIKGIKDLDTAKEYVSENGAYEVFDFKKAVKFIEEVISLSKQNPSNSIPSQIQKEMENATSGKTLPADTQYVFIADAWDGFLGDKVPSMKTFKDWGSASRSYKKFLEDSNFNQGEWQMGLYKCEAGDKCKIYVEDNVQKVRGAKKVHEFDYMEALVDSVSIVGEDKFEIKFEDDDENYANGGGILSRIQAAEAERLAKRENELKKIEAIQPLIDEIYNKDKSAYGLDPDQDTDVFVINFKSKDGNNYALLFRYIKMNQYVTGTGPGPFNRKNLGPEDIEERLSFGQVELYKVDSTLDFMDIKNVEEIYSSNHPVADTAFTPIFDKIAGKIIDLKGDDLRIAMEIESAEYKNDYYANGGGIGNVKIEIKPQYYDEKDNRENVALKYDVNYLITFDNKDFIELTGTLKPYHTGRDYEYEFEPSWFADDTESNYYEENSEKIEKEILDKFYSTTFANGGGVNKGKELWFSPSGEVKAEAKGTARKYIERHLAKRFGAESMELVGEDEKDYIYELNGNPMMIAAQTAILEEENGLEVESYGRKKRVHIPKSGIDQTSVHLRYPLITPFKNGGGVGTKNKYQTAKEYFEDLYSKMNSNQKSIYNKEYTRLAKYFGDDANSFSDKDVAEYIESTINELVDSDYKLQAHSITIPFFKLGHKYIAYWNAYKQPEWWDGNEYKNGGFVGKGELVWRKLSSSDRIDFLYKNFTPEITPRSQEILVGKTYNFLPRNVKMALNSKYANVEEYKAGGSVGRKRHLYAIMMGKYSQMDNPQYVEVSGRNMDEAMSKFKQMGVDAVPEHIHFSNKPPYYYKNGGGIGIDSQIEELEAVKAILNNKLLDISMGVVDRKEKPKVENQMQIISSQINELLKKKYGRKMTNGGGLDTDDFEMDNSTYTIRMWDTDMDKLNRVEPLQMTYKIKSQALDLANRFHYENNYGIVEVEDENGNRILTLDAYAANGKSISMNVTECERCHQPTDNVTTMSMFNKDVICMSCKEKERKNPHYEKAHAADIEQIKQGNYNYEGMGYLPDNYYQHAIMMDGKIYTGDSYYDIVSNQSPNLFNRDESSRGYVDNMGEFFDEEIGNEMLAADGKPIQEADYLTNAMLSVLDLKNYLDSHNDQIIINGSKYNYYSHGQYNLRVTGGQGAIYNIIPYFPETTVGQLQNAKFYTLLRKLKTYSFAISVDGLVLDVAEDGLAIA